MFCDAGVNTWKLITDYMTAQNIDRTHVNAVGIKDGVPITTVNPDVTLTFWGDAGCDDACDVADAVLIARYASGQDKGRCHA